jgi:hypothetical protein
VIRSHVTGVRSPGRSRSFGYLTCLKDVEFLVFCNHKDSLPPEILHHAQENGMKDLGRRVLVNIKS